MARVVVRPHRPRGKPQKVGCSHKIRDPPCEMAGVRLAFCSTSPKHLRAYPADERKVSRALFIGGAVPPKVVGVPTN